MLSHTVKFTSKPVISIYVYFILIANRNSLSPEKNIYISHNIEWTSHTITHQNTSQNNVKYFELIQSRNL